MGTFGAAARYGDEPSGVHYIGRDEVRTFYERLLQALPGLQIDVQRNHVGMIRRSMKLLRPSGRLVFSTNYTRFKLDAEALADLVVEDISARTIPKDFERHARIHRCFSVTFS